MTKEQEAVLKRALDHYGIDNQLTKAVEEMAELTKEICKSGLSRTFWKKRRMFILH